MTLFVAVKACFSPFKWSWDPLLLTSNTRAYHREMVDAAVKAIGCRPRHMAIDD